MDTCTRKVSSPELYDTVWRTVADFFYDRPRLVRWNQWRYRFDDQMRDDADAYHFIGVMLSSLQDRYTYLMTPPAVGEDRAVLTSPEPAALTEWLPGGIGYIRVDTFHQNYFLGRFERAMEHIADADGFILDLRDNRGGLIHPAHVALSFFLDDGVLSDSELWQGGLPQRRVTRLHDDRVEETCLDRDGNVLERFSSVRYPNITAGRRLAVLINRYTKSAAELFAAALRDQRPCRLIGEDSAGKGIRQTTIPMPNGCALVVTSGVLFTPSGQWLGDDAQTYRDPLRPHVRIHGRARDGYDPAIDAALRYIRPQRAARSGSGGLALATLGAAALLMTAATRRRRTA